MLPFAGWMTLSETFLHEQNVCASVCLGLFVCVIALLKVKPFIIAPKFTAAIIFTVYIMLLVIQNFGGQQEPGCSFVHLSAFIFVCSCVSVVFVSVFSLP